MDKTNALRLVIGNTEVVPNDIRIEVGMVPPPARGRDAGDQYAVERFISCGCGTFLGRAAPAWPGHDNTARLPRARSGRS